MDMAVSLLLLLEGAAKGLDVEELFFLEAGCCLGLGESSSANGLVESSSSSCVRRPPLIVPNESGAKATTEE